MARDFQGHVPCGYQLNIDGCRVEGNQRIIRYENQWGRWMDLPVDEYYNPGRIRRLRTLEEMIDHLLEKAAAKLKEWSPSSVKAMSMKRLVAEVQSSDPLLQERRIEFWFDLYAGATGEILDTVTQERTNP